MADFALVPNDELGFLHPPANHQIPDTPTLKALFAFPGALDMPPLQ